MSLQCNNSFFSIDHYIKAMLGVNANGISFRMMQIESVGDYFTCAGVKDVDTPENLFRILVDENMCAHPVLRVDVQTDDGLCTNWADCNNSGLDAFTALKNAVGMGADGGPVLRIMLSSGLS